MSETIQPLADRILVEPDAAATSNGSIIIPENSKEKPQRGKVIATGHNISRLSVIQTSEDGQTTIEVTGKVLQVINPGDTILFAKHAGTEITIDGKRHLLMRESECFAILKKSDA